MPVKKQLLHKNVNHDNWRTNKSLNQVISKIHMSAFIYSGLLQVWKPNCLVEPCTFKMAAVLKKSLYWHGAIRSSSKMLVTAQEKIVGIAPTICHSDRSYMLLVTEREPISNIRVHISLQKQDTWFPAHTEQFQSSDWIQFCLLQFGMFKTCTFKIGDQRHGGYWAKVEFQHCNDHYSWTRHTQVFIFPLIPISDRNFHAALSWHKLCTGVKADFHDSHQYNHCRNTDTVNATGVQLLHCGFSFILALTFANGHIFSSLIVYFLK